MSMFQQDKPLGMILSAAADIFLLSVAALLSMLPVITAGASAISLFEQAYAILEKREGSVLKDFFRGLFHNFSRGLGLLLFWIADGIIIAGVTGSAGVLGLPVRPIAAAAMVVFGGAGCWAMALMGRYEQKAWITIQNSFYLAIRFLPVTLLLGLIHFGVPALVWVMPEELFSGYLFVLLFFAPAGCAMISGMAVMKLMKKQFPDQERTEF